MINYWGKEDIELLHKIYPTEGSSIYLQNTLHRSELAITQKAYKLGIKRTKSIDTSVIEMNKFLAYTLGLLWADGCIQQYTGKTKYTKKDLSVAYSISHYNYVSLEVAKEDMDEFLPILRQSGIEWSSEYVRKRNSSWKATSTVKSTGIAIYNYFYALGYKEKTSPSKVIDIIPEDLKLYWFRGFFDGDGGVYYLKRRHLRQIQFAGPKDYDWQFLQSFLYELRISPVQVYNTKNKKGEGSALRFSGKQNLKKFFDSVFNDEDQVYLYRKYKKLKQIIYNWEVLS